MSIWGKILGGGIGFALGGPIGALIGVAGGHFMDWMQQPPKDSVKSQEDRQVAFTIAIVVLSAKMAKADGHVSQVEIDRFHEICQIPDQYRNHAERLFQQAQKDSRGYEIYAKQMVQLFKGDESILAELLWILAQIAHADGKIHHDEQRILQDIAGIFGIDDDDFERITELTIANSDGDPYRILGVAADDSDDAIKKAHRNLVREHHPDLLTAKGMPQEFIDFSTEKLARINEAYDRIKKQRGI